LIKLVYIAHGWHYGALDKPLINEHPEAWQYGPVIPSVYHEFKAFGDKPISRAAMDFDLETSDLVPTPRPESPSAKVIVERIWDLYRPYSAVQLSSLTHRAGTPWYITWHERGGKDIKGTDIAPDLIRDYYKKAIEGVGAK